MKTVLMEMRNKINPFFPWSEDCNQCINFDVLKLLSQPNWTEEGSKVIMLLFICFAYSFQDQRDIYGMLFCMS